MKQLGKITTIIVYIAIIGYLTYLISHNTMIAAPSLADNNMIVSIGIGILLLLTSYYATRGATALSKPKLILSCCAILIIFAGGYLLQDNASINVFIADMIKVVGVYTLIGALAGWIGIVPVDPNKPYANIKNVEIIEV